MISSLPIIADRVLQAFPGGEVTAVETNGELRINVNSENLIGMLEFLKDDGACQFKMLIGICGADYPQRRNRFDVVYLLLSLRHNVRVRVHVDANEDTVIPSVSCVFSAAGWFEREVWDMYGVIFGNHEDLRRILTDYGFVGHPLRKDFPLTGHVEVRYDHEKKRVVYEPVKLDQEFRYFDNLSPWEGTQYVLPGDEKAKA
ncbi:MAG: NADH-quinone oxidoreductase subunit C [Alphaproteobacteria bacterium]|nr:NADH-quinone oxidoreductase subunit C [Alphaproteobacteria bacterium]